MGSRFETDDRAIRIALLRARFDAASHALPGNAFAARSRALLDQVLSLLEEARDESQPENRDS